MAKVSTDKMVLALSKLVVSPKAQDNLLKLEKSFTIVYQYEGNIKEVYIPYGTMYDGASFPLGSRFDPKYLRAALVHDVFCWALDETHFFKLPFTFTVEEMSELFGEILKLDGVSYIQAEIMEMAVTIYKSFA